MFACGRETDCFWIPIGHDEWIVAPNYIEPYRSFMTMVVVSGLVFIAGGRTIASGNF